MNQLNKILLVISIVLSSATASYAQDDIMNPKSHPILVNDDAGLFSISERVDLEQMLVAYNDSTSTQIAVITTKSLNGYAAGDYAARLGEEWGVGRNGKDNGIVILIKPRIGNERGEIFIATGYGVEHKLTDARVGRIIDNYMIPYLPDDYYRATKTASLAMMDLLSGEFQADTADDAGEDAMMTFLIAAVLFIVIVYAISKSSKNDGGSNRSDDNSSSGSGSQGSGPVFFPPMGRGFGRSSSGGRPSGGFGGFGGGRFGGGGAGRSF